MRNDTDYAPGAGYPEQRPGETGPWAARPAPAHPELANVEAAERDGAAADDAESDPTGERVLTEDDLKSIDLESNTDLESNYVTPDAHPGAVDEADAEEDAEDYDDALAAEPVTDAPYDPAAEPDEPDADAERAAEPDADPETELAETPPGYAGSEYVEEERQPVVDSFVDEERGADPYGVPEPADTSVHAGTPLPPPSLGTEPVLPGEPGYPDAGSDVVAQAAPVVPPEDVAYLGVPDPTDTDPADAHRTDAEVPALALAGAGAAGAAAGSRDLDSAPDDEAIADGAGSAASAEMMPGDADSELAPMAVLIPADVAEQLRARWQQLQLRFIDNPRQTADHAQELVGQVVDALTSALASQRDSLDDWKDGRGEDTEILRAAVMRYRDFFDRLLGL
jgi:hypothetical protein